METGVSEDGRRHPDTCTTSWLRGAKNANGH